MRRLIRALVAVILASAVSALAASTAGAGRHPGTIGFVSGTDWNTFSVDPGASRSGPGPGFIGLAQNVCLNATSPSPCPAGALVYNAPSGWHADLSLIPGATWIWAPGITAATTPADLASFYFSKTIKLRGQPQAGTIYVAVDDFAEVIVNGVVVGSTGSLTDFGAATQAQNNLKAFDVVGALRPGNNTITIHAQNGAASLPGICNPCSYAVNNAGVVFGGTITRRHG